MNNCGTCVHWTKPEERTNYANVVRFHDESYDSRLGDYPRGGSDDKLFGHCGLINMGIELSVRDETPLAVTMDGSEYKADLYTQAEFGCVLWSDDDSS